MVRSGSGHGSLSHTLTVDFMPSLELVIMRPSGAAATLVTGPVSPRSVTTSPEYSGAAVRKSTYAS